MKKSLIILSLVISAATFVGADVIRTPEAPVVEEKKFCRGYTVIEAGLGIDCYGDTVKLVNRYGYYELVKK